MNKEDIMSDDDIDELVREFDHYINDAQGRLMRGGSTKAVVKFWYEKLAAKVNKKEVEDKIKKIESRHRLEIRELAEKQARYIVDDLLTSFLNGRFETW